MKTISLKVDDYIFNETENILAKMNIPRNRYINEAIKCYNKAQKRQILEKLLRQESELCASESLNVLQQFEEIDYAS